ncbi:7918_t:CDS:1, partial [Racocetra fulgida]
MSTYDPDQFNSYNNEIAAWSNEDEFQLNESNASNISENLENLHNSDAESNSNSPDQSTSRITG